MDGAAWILLLSEMTVVVSCHQICFIGSESNPHSGIKLRWFLSYKDPCQCTSIRLGGTGLPTSFYHQGAPYYLPELFLSEDPGQIKAYFSCNCPSTANANWDIYLTNEAFPSADAFDEAAKQCRMCNMQLCSLSQMKIALEFEYRNMTYGLYGGSESTKRKARVSDCDSAYIDQECFYEGNEIPTVPLSDGEKLAAYCCPSTGPLITVAKFNNREVAEWSCRGPGVKLCPLEWLEYANIQGYVTIEWGWFESPSVFANVTGKGVVVRNYDRTAGRLQGYCCPMENSFILSQDQFNTAHDEAQAFCSSIGFHLCSLAELKAARDRGFWSETWGHYEVEGRDVKVMDCKHWSGSECYKEVIANTPRPTPPLRAYCCP